MELNLCFGMEHSGLSRAEDHEDSRIGIRSSGMGLLGVCRFGELSGSA